MELVEATGFDAFDAGGLATSWRQQPGTPAYCTELTADELKTALEKADANRSADNRETLIKGFMEGGDSLTHDDIVARNRTVTVPPKARAPSDHRDQAVVPPNFRRRSSNSLGLLRG
ncbi:hypothetical protein LPB79_37630 (plasmid) [Rhizobium sp. T136]|nr:MULTISPECIES: hypothetical protein [Rhizobium]UFS85773.1 hypothetical protein LPB79_37630 [Rhizobium sp. T136]